MAIERTGIKPSLPKVSARRVGGVPVGSVAPVGVLQRLRQGIRLTRDDHQMYVVGHQAVAQQQKIVELNVGPQEVQIHDTFGIGSENELPRIATLGDMVRDVNHRNTG